MSEPAKPIRDANRKLRYAYMAFDENDKYIGSTDRRCLPGDAYFRVQVSDGVRLVVIVPGESHLLARDVVC